ncbi:MAG: polymer-forming cytoskeletal protein [Thermaerobacter sp.]|nr:polymer-forming cytoskeletal protein [Thermaerobacter sp.]
MFGRKRLHTVDTVIGKECAVEGDLTGGMSMRVDGRVSGSIRLEGDLFIGEGAQVRARIQARNVFVAGEVTGDVEAGGELELAPSGKVYGDVVVAKLAVADGAMLQGNCRMSQREVVAGVAHPSGQD